MALPIEDPNTLIPSILTHLTTLTSNSSTTLLDSDLLKRGERSLDTRTPQHLLWQLLTTGEPLLPLLIQHQQDPQPLTRLLTHIITLIPFDDLITTSTSPSTNTNTITPTKLINGLTSTSSPPIQLLCLAYLSKAASSPSGASWLAASSPLVQSLITTWLSVENTEVAERGLECLIALLEVDSPDSSTVVAAAAAPGEDHRILGEAQGQGLFWRRLFYDADVYSLFFRWTTLDPERSGHDLSTKKGKQAVTISQARLFDFLARVAAVLEWAHITTSTLPDVERPYYYGSGSSSSGTTQQQSQQSQQGQQGQQSYSGGGSGGLMRYASSHMIDSSDILMEVLRQDFFMKLLGVVQDEQQGGSGSSNSSSSSRRRIPPRLLEAIHQEVGGGFVANGQQQQQQQQGGMHL